MKSKAESCSTRVKLFAEKSVMELEHEVNNWLSANTVDNVEFQYGCDLSYWSCLVIYKLPVKEEETP